MSPMSSQSGQHEFGSFKLRPRSSVALWSKRGLTTLLIPRHDPPSDIAIFMDINPNPGPSSVQGNLNPSRSAETHLQVHLKADKACLIHDTSC